MHDIFIPWDYPDEWKERYYNEQYLLASYLIGGAGGDEIILPNTYLSYYDPELLAPLAQVFKDARFNGAEKTGTAFWMKKG